MPNSNFSSQIAWNKAESLQFGIKYTNLSTPSLVQHYGASAQQKWADCEIFQSKSNHDKIESDPVLICKIFRNHQSHPVLIRPRKIMNFYFASWGKSTTEAILLSAKYDWLKAK